MFETINLRDLNQSPVALLGEQWTLITAGTKERCNTMTASWGGLGVLWGSPMATIYVRPQRYTKEFLDQEDYFSLSFFGEEHRKSLVLCGKESGREQDKIQQCGFTMAFQQAPYMEEADLVLLCRKRYVQEMNPLLIPEDVKKTWYPQEDYHHIYYGEVLEVLRKS